MKAVVVISPFRNERGHRTFAKLCMRDCLERGEAPFASHVLYPLVLADADPDERALGMAAGRVWLQLADKAVVYMDRGVSEGMEADIETALLAGIPVERRTLIKGDRDGG